MARRGSKMPRARNPEAEFAANEREILRLRDSELFDRSAADYQRKLKKYVESKLKGTAQKLRSDPIGGRTIHDFYFEAPLVKRRAGAMLRYMPEAVRRFSDKYPTMSIEAEFAELNTTPCNRTYDMEESYSYICTAIAIFILDDLCRNLRLPEAVKFLPDWNEFWEDVLIPEDFRDCQYDNDLISALVWLIQERNAEEKGCAYDSWLIDAAAADRTEEQRSGTGHSRERLDQILSLLNPITVERAVKRFEDKMWEFMDTVLQGVQFYREKQIPACNRLLQMTKELRERWANLQTHTLHSMEMPSVMAPPNPLMPLESSFLHSGPSTAEQLLYMAREAESLHHECVEFSSRMTAVRMMSVGASDYGPDVMRNMIAPEVIEILKSFTVQNPYETCFAFFWLLDTGSDLPWLINMGAGVVSAAASLLPWTMQDNPNRDDEEDDWSEEIWEDDGEDTSEADGLMDSEPTEQAVEEVDVADLLEDKPTLADDPMEGKPPKDWIEKEAALYRQNYTDASMWMEPENADADTLFRWNLPQLVYAYSGTVMPRDVYSFDSIDEELAPSGVDPETGKALEPYLKLASVRKLYLHEMRNPFQNETELTDSEETDPPAAGAEDVGENVETLQEKIRELKSEVRQLKSSLHDSIREASSERNRRKDAETEHEQDRQELVGLRELIFKLQSESREVEPDSSSRISFPYRTQHRIVSFGGHESWLKAIQPMLPDVRFVPSDMQPDVNMIHHADMVWIQTNAISHKRYYKIMEVVRKHKIALHYFTYASAEKCARQLAGEDMKTGHGKGKRRE